MSEKSSSDARRKKVIDALNQARGMELFAIIQYMNHHYGLDDQDYGKLAKKMKDIAIDEMRHAEELAERIKDMDGEPTTEIIGKVKKGQKVKEIFAYDAAVEEDTLETYNKIVKICKENGDHVSSTLMERILNEEQEHFNYFDDQATHLKELGDTFLAEMVGGSAD